MTNNKEDSLEQDLITTEQIQRPEPQSLFNQNYEIKKQYTRDLATVLEQEQIQQQPVVEITEQKPKKKKKQKDQQKQPKRPSSARNIFEKIKAREMVTNQILKPQTLRQPQVLVQQPSTSNMVKTISQRMSNFENKTAELRAVEADLQN